MATLEKTLKSQNWKYIYPYIGLNIIVFYVIVMGSDGIWQLAETALKSTLWAGAASILAVILNGLLDSHIKAVLVFWRLHDPLPGCRAFSHYMNTDPRIAPHVLQTRYGQFPHDPAQQNSLWYRIYRKNENHPSIRDAHANYLLTRDLAALSLIFLVLLGPAALYLQVDTKWALFYLVGLAVVYGFASQAARSYGKRLVTSALAIESSTS
jgi:hypothetical protein